MQNSANGYSGPRFLANEIENIIGSAVSTRKAHLAVGRPMRSIKEGFREANIAHDMSWAFRSRGFLTFPEFPVQPRGAVDALFIRDDVIVVAEWKRLYRRAIPEVIAQTHRMLGFNPNRDLQIHSFCPRQWTVVHLWVCDVWDTYDDSLKWWFCRPSKIKEGYLFNRPWKVGKECFPHLNPAWSNYSWVWAHRVANYASATPVIPRRGSQGGVRHFE